MRAAFVCSVWSDGLLLADPGVVLNLLDGPAVGYPGYHVVQCRFRMLRRHTAYNTGVYDHGRVHGLLRVGAPGHGRTHLLLPAAASQGFSCFPDLCVWQRPGLLNLCQVSSPLLGCLEEYGP